MSDLYRLIPAHDYMRVGVPGGMTTDHKEWHHFCVLGSDVDVIANFSLSRDVRYGCQVGRVILLVREAHNGWDGDVDSVPARDVLATAGDTAMQVGSNSLRFGPDGYTISISLQERPLTARLTLAPRSLPLLARTNAVIGDGRVSWLMVPRLSATGTVVVDRRVYRLDQAPAYHDHNWGHWRCGQDFAWQWGFGLPDGHDYPWTVVFQRMTDRTRNTTTELIMALWYGGDLYRLFHQKEIDVRMTGPADAEPALKLPRVLSLVAPGQTSDVPDRLVVTARSGRDCAQMTFETRDLAQVLVPNETDLGMTIINEVRGRVHLDGHVKGNSIASEGEGIYEFLT
jgi:hypothetical protein